MKITLVLIAIAAAAAVTASIDVNDHERGLIMNRKAFPKTQWNLVGFAAKDAKMSFVIGLKNRNLDVLEKKFWSVSDPTSPEYQQFMTYHEIQDIIAPTTERREAVIAWLHRHGVLPSQIEDRRDNFAVVTTVAIVEALFKTELFLFKHTRRNIHIIRQLGPYSMPKALWSTVVDIVAGVSDFPPFDRRLHQTDGTEAIIPAVLSAQYNIPSGASAASTSQGVAEFGAGEYFDPNDLQTFAKAVNVPVTALAKDHIISPDPPAGIEGQLDIEFISTVGVDSVNWYWANNAWLYEWGTAVSAATAKPEIISISYGWSELAQCDIDPTGCQQIGVESEGYVAKVNTLFQQIGLQGTSLLSASGDSGANGRTDEDCTAPQLRPEFPGVSPYLTSVGATQLTNPTKAISNPPSACTSQGYSCNYGGQETAVSFDQASFTSGGGFSNYVPRPSYQAAAVSAYLSSGVKLPPSTMYNASNRAHPDVASLGTSILIYSQSMGGWALVGGTSASAPSFAGYMSLLNAVTKAKNGKPLGFLNPFLYKMYSDNPATFTDITVGDNICTESGCQPSCKGFYCAKGWDPVTGLGVANVEAMIAYVKAM